MDDVWENCWIASTKRSECHRGLLPGRENILQHLYPHWSVDYLVIPSPLDQAAEIISKHQFHLLLYWEVGTDSTNYFLPFFRPAIIQAATWGWPVTTGNRRVDEFVSAACLEPSDGQKHYTETLITLEGVPTFYQRPPVPKPLKTRQELGMKEKDHIYFCPQNLRKIHPDFDHALAGILRSDPEGQILLLADEQPTITELLKIRFRRTIPDVISRIFILSRMPREVYLNVLA